MRLSNSIKFKNAYLFQISVLIKMIYSTYNPCKELNSLVKCYWTLDDAKNKKQGKQIILPDGCIELIFHYGDLYKQYLDKIHFVIQPKSFVFGQITKPLEIEPTGETGIFAVRFYPDGFIPFADIPLQKMENKAIPLNFLFGNKGTNLENKVLFAKFTEERIILIEEFLKNFLKDTKSIDRTIKACVNTILELKGIITVENMVKDFKINRRQLERKFSLIIGLSPKQLSKIIRLQSTLKTLKSSQNKNLTSAANEGNFYDQSHFIKDFKEFTGLSPKKFFAENLKISNLFISQKH